MTLHHAGIECGGQGWCKSMSQWAATVGLTYGAEYNARAYPGKHVACTPVVVMQISMIYMHHFVS